MASTGSKQKAVIFVDGNNWYHSLKEAGVSDRLQLDYTRISRKLVAGREWCQTRYYIGRVPQGLSTSLYADQRRFVSLLQAQDKRISVHFGRLEPRRADDASAKRLLKYLSELKTPIDRSVYRDLHDIATEHNEAIVWVEKAVDVNLAMDLVVMAAGGELDTAYILSADGDYTPAVRMVRSVGKQVIAASCTRGHNSPKPATFL